MAIVRKAYFATVSNAFLRNQDLSFKAKGLFTYMSSFNDSWNFTVRSIATQSKDGRDGIQSAIDELKEKGFLTYEKHSDGTGTYTLFEKPRSENPSQENTTMGKADRIKKIQPSKKNNTYQDFLSQLKAAVSYKTKVSSTKDGERLFKEIEDKGKLFSDYVKHQEEKKEFSVRITSFMEDYKTVYQAVNNAPIQGDEFIGGLHVKQI